MGLCCRLAGASPAWAGAMWAAGPGCLDTAGPWLQPSPASGTSCCQQHISGSRLLQRGGTTGPAWQPPPQLAPVRASEDEGRSWQGAGAAGLGPEGIPGEAAAHTHCHMSHLRSCRWASSLPRPCLRTPPGSHPVQLPAAFPGRQPAPGAGPPLHKHDLAARLVLVVLALPRIYHPARRKQGVKALSFRSRSSRRHRAAPHPP